MNKQSQSCERTMVAYVEEGLKHTSTLILVILKFNELPHFNKD
jgi:hypothetical protein